MVFLEDCMTGMRQYPDGYFDLAICDPPYGKGVGTMQFVENGVLHVRQKNGGYLRLPKKRYSKNNFDSCPPDETYFSELQRVSKNQIVFGIDFFDWSVGGGRFVWDKCVPDGVSFSRYETAYCSLIAGVERFELLFSGMLQAESLLNPRKAQGDKRRNEKRIHPCQKPVLLYAWLLQRFAKPGSRILDTHVGSGSSRIAAWKLNFDFTGFEIDSTYFKAQEERFLAEAFDLFSSPCCV